MGHPNWAGCDTIVPKNVDEKMWEHSRNVDEKMLTALLKNVGDISEKCWQHLRKMLMKKH
jgi:hypothetical protein